MTQPLHAACSTAANTHRCLDRLVNMPALQPLSGTAADHTHHAAHHSCCHTHAASVRAAQDAHRVQPVSLVRSCSEDQPSIYASAVFYQSHARLHATPSMLAVHLD